MTSTNQHITSLSATTRLSTFSAHLLENKVEEFIIRKIAVGADLNLALGNNNDEGATSDGGYSLTKESATELLTYLSEGRGSEYVAISLKKWKQNKQPLFSRENFQADDITKWSFLRKQVFLSFLPDYCKDVAEAVEVVKEIDAFLLEWETALSNTYITLLKAHIEEHAHFIERITNTSPGIIYVYDVVNDKEVYANKTISEFIGYDADEIIGMGTNFVELLIHPEDVPHIRNHEKAFADIADGEIRSIKYRIKKKGADYQWLRAYESAFKRNETGAVVQKIGIAIDVHAQVEIAQKLRRSEELYKQAQALAHIGNWTYQMDTGEFEWSDEMYRIYDLPLGERITQRHWEEFIHPEDRNDVIAYAAKITATLGRYDRMHRIVLKNGTVKTIYRKGAFVFDAAGNALQMIGTTQDVTEQQKMQVDLDENRQFISKIANATPSIIASYNVNSGQYSFISEGLTKLLGYNVDEAKEKGISFFIDRVHPQDLPTLMQANEKSIEEANRTDNNEVKEFVYRMRHQNGQYRWIHTYGTVFDRNAKGQVENLLNISLDITEEVEANKKIEEQELFIQQIADASPTILYIFDIVSNSFEYVNKEIYFVLGYSTDEVKQMDGNVIQLLYHPEDIHLLPERRESSKKFQHVNSMIQYECRVKSKNDDWKWLLVREIIFKNENGDRPAQILGAALDITKRKEMERSLLQNSFQLEQSNASLEEFAYVASHDLKEPLRKISTFGDRLVATQGERLTNDGHIYLKKIIDASQRMQLMISDLLSIAMISGNQAYELYSLQSVLEDVMQTLDFKIEQKNAVVNFAGLPEAYIVVSQFRQLFQNLLSNSLKFTKENVQPVIDITSSYLTPEDVGKYKLSNANRYLQLKVSDNGIGFEETYAGKIFQIFQRLHGRSEYEGTGIGLAICKKIVEHHGGIIFATGVEGSGATFTIIIPS